MNKHTPELTSGIDSSWITLSAHRRELGKMAAEIERLAKRLGVERDLLAQREDQLTRLKALLKMAEWAIGSHLRHFDEQAPTLNCSSCIKNEELLRDALTDIQKEGL